MEHLASIAYQAVGTRLATAGVMAEGERRAGLRRRRQRVWRAVEPTASLNALTRVAWLLRNGEDLSEPDLVLLSLFQATGLLATVRREFAEDFPLPADPRLPAQLSMIVAATRQASGAITRRRLM